MSLSEDVDGRAQASEATPFFRTAMPGHDGADRTLRPETRRDISRLARHAPR
jgi:hypothetical protein